MSLNLIISVFTTVMMIGDELEFSLLSAWFWIGFFSTLILILFHPTYSLRLCPKIL